MGSHLGPRAIENSAAVCAAPNFIILNCNGVALFAGAEGEDGCVNEEVGAGAIASCSARAAGSPTSTSSSVAVSLSCYCCYYIRKEGETSL